PPPPPRTKPNAGDTVSAAGADTGRMHRDEDLTLAPIDDERDAFGSGASKSDVTSVSAVDLNVDVQALSRIEEEIGESSTSGSMIDLLSDPHLHRVSMSGVVLRRKQNSIPPWVIILSCVGGIVLVGLLILLLSRIV
ncbi:MAG: hypothetical protein KDB23_21665, partial [Planctomycetales bacterium]|nr:hypothetical protein [Planctomycetales bacterium]